MRLSDLPALPDIQPKNIIKYLKDHPDIVKDLEVNRGIPARIAQLNIEVVPTTMALIDQSQPLKPNTVSSQTTP